MDAAALKAALGAGIPTSLAEDLVDEFFEIRRDVATRTLGRASPGKFVETVVQILQALENNGKYDQQPNVDGCLRGLESRTSTLPDGLRICASRLARAMYALRSKRSIVHKGAVDPSAYDLRLLYAGAQWMVAEFLALTSGISATDAGTLIEQVQLPVSELVEAIDGRQIVHGDMTIREEALVVLMNHYPHPVSVADVVRSMDRRAPGSVRNVLGGLWRDKLLHRAADKRVVLTERGLRTAIQTASAHLE